MVAAIYIGEHLNRTISFVISSHVTAEKQNSFFSTPCKSTDWNCQLVVCLVIAAGRKLGYRITKSSCTTGFDQECNCTRLWSEYFALGCILLGLLWLFLFRFRNNRVHGISISKRTFLLKTEYPWRR